MARILTVASIAVATLVGLAPLAASAGQWGSKSSQGVTEYIYSTSGGGRKARADRHDRFFTTNTTKRKVSHRSFKKKRGLSRKRPIFGRTIINQRQIDISGRYDRR